MTSQSANQVRVFFKSFGLYQQRSICVVRRVLSSKMVEFWELMNKRPEYFDTLVNFHERSLSYTIQDETYKTPKLLHIKRDKKDYNVKGCNDTTIGKHFIYDSDDSDDAFIWTNVLPPIREVNSDDDGKLPSLSSVLSYLSTSTSTKIT